MRYGSEYFTLFTYITPLKTATRAPRRGVGSREPERQTAMRSKHFKLAATSMQEMSRTLSIEEFREVLFKTLEKLMPASVITLNSLGQQDGSIYCRREGELVHETYAAELPDLWPAQSALLDTPPVTERNYATTLGRQAGSATEADVSGCVEFYSALKVDDSAALLLNYEHEYFGLLCVNTSGVSDSEKTVLEDFLELIGPVASSHYAILNRRSVFSGISENLMKLHQRAGRGGLVIDRHGKIHAASENILNILKSSTFTNRAQLRDGLKNWLIEASKPGTLGTEKPMKARIGEYNLNVQYLRRYGNKAETYNWHLLEVKVSHPSISSTLTYRELEVAECVSCGMTDTQIAQELGLSFSTARKHVAVCLSKLSLSNRTELAMWYAKEHMNF